MRTIGTTAMKGLLAQSTELVFIDLIQVDHEDLPEPLYFCANTVDFVSGGHTWIAAPIRLELPQEPSDQVPTARLSVANVDRILIAAIRQLQSPPTITAKIVHDVFPNAVQYGPVSMRALSVQYDRDMIVFELGFDSLTNEPFPFLTLSPAHYPGMFK
jgi:hypothetical protein